MWGFLVAAFSVLYVPLIVLDSEQIDVISSGFANSDFQEDDYNAVDDQNSSSDHHDQRHRDDEWFEEQLEDDLKWSFSLNRYRNPVFVHKTVLLLVHFILNLFCVTLFGWFLGSVLHAVTSQFQNIALLDTPRFGKVIT